MKSWPVPRTVRARYGFTLVLASLSLTIIVLAASFLFYGNRARAQSPIPSDSQPTVDQFLGQFVDTYTINLLRDSLTQLYNFSPQLFYTTLNQITAARCGNGPAASGGICSRGTNAPVSLLNFGTAGVGGDDTAVFQKALNSTAANGQILEIPTPPGAPTYNINPIFFPSNANMLVDANVVIQANSGYGLGDKMLNIVNVSSVRIAGGAGATFKMRKAEYTSGEHRHCLNIEGATNVTISGIACNDSGGDGVYIGAGSQGYSSNITVEDSTFNNNRRQGMSLVSGSGIFVRRSRFTNTNGTPPQAGVDIEPNNASELLTNVHIEDSFTDNNAGSGILFNLNGLDNTSQPVDITVLRHHATANAREGYEAHSSETSTSTVQGTVLIDSSFSDLSGEHGAAGIFYQAAGPSLIFNNLTVTNPMQKGSDVYGDTSAVAGIRGGGAVGPLGNIHFIGTNVISTDGKIGHYFTFQDYSLGGQFNKIQFLNPGTLSGAKVQRPYGLLQGQGVDSVDLPPATSVTVTAPASGSTLTQGSRFTISWTGGTPTVNVNLWQSGAYLAGLASGISNTGSFAWTVPATYSGTGFQIQIGSVGISPGYAGYSGTFSIQAPATCEYAAPPPDCNWVPGPNYDPQTGCGRVLSCPAASPSGGAKFQIGDSVRTTANLNVRTDPSLSADIFGSEPKRSQGSISDGPVSADGYTWWLVDYDDGVSGWSVDTFLKKISVRSPASNL